jgi:Sulfotransferase family
LFVTQQLLEEAKVISGLDEYGTTDFIEGLEVLVRSINTEAGLTPEYAARYRQELLRLLVNRLRMQKDFTEHPEIHEQTILPPVFITSLPRTGSTKLMRMLAATGDFHSHNHWQSHNFARFPSVKDGEPDPRIRESEQFLQWIRRQSPLFDEGHPMYTDDADEVMLLMDAGFNSLFQHAAYLYVPSYIEWVLKLDASLMYEDLKRILKYLQWQHFPDKTRRWLLKTPSAFGTEADFTKVFPETDFIVTHRSPREMMASGAALTKGVGEIFYDHLDEKKAGQMSLYNFSEMSKKHISWRKQNPPQRFLDLRFVDIVKNEFEVIESIYRFLGLAFDAGAWQGVEGWLKMDRERRGPSQKFTLQDFGLDAGGVDQCFADYIDYYRDYL